MAVWGPWVTQRETVRELGSQQYMDLNQGRDYVHYHGWKFPYNAFGEGTRREIVQEEFHATSYGAHFSDAGDNVRLECSQILTWVTMEPFERPWFDRMVDWSPETWWGYDPVDQGYLDYETADPGYFNLTVRATVPNSFFFVPTGGLDGRKIYVRNVPTNLTEWIPGSQKLQWINDVPPGYGDAGTWPLLDTLTILEYDDNTVFEFSLDPYAPLHGDEAISLAAHLEWLETGEQPPLGPPPSNYPPFIMFGDAAVGLMEIHATFKPPTTRFLYEDAGYPRALHQRQRGIPGMQQQQYQWW